MFIGTTVYRHPRLYTAMNGYVGVSQKSFKKKFKDPKVTKVKTFPVHKTKPEVTTPKTPKVKQSVQRAADQAAEDADIQVALTAETNLRNLIGQVHAGAVPSTGAVFTYPNLTWTSPGLKQIKKRIDKLVDQLAKAGKEARLLEEAKLLNENKSGNGNGNGGGGGNDDTGGGGGSGSLEQRYIRLDKLEPDQGNGLVAANEGPAAESGPNWLLYGGLAVAAAGALYLFTRKKKGRK